MTPKILSSCHLVGQPDSMTRSYLVTLFSMALPLGWCPRPTGGWAARPTSPLAASHEAFEPEEVSG